MHPERTAQTPWLDPAEVVFTSDVDVITALRIADQATDDDGKFGRVASAILKMARETPSNNTGGLELLLRLQRDGLLAFQVGNE